MSMTRRDAIRAGLALGLSATAAGAAVAAVQEPSLNALAARTGRRFGSAIGNGPRNALAASYRDGGYRALVASQCGVIVPENELKWGRVRPSAAAFDFNGADQLLAFAEANKLAFRGHTLLWHHPRWTPAWVASHDFGATPATAVERMIRDHVTTVCRRYGSRIHSYDVVNETIDEQTGAMRDTPFTRHMPGEAVVDIAFHAAREAAPRAQLVYNDYMGWGAGSAKHRAGVLALLEGFRKRNVPVDALGVQSHLGDGDREGRQEGEWRRFLDQVIALNYDLVITEFDINDKTLPADVAVRDGAVADLARAYLDLMLGYDQLGDILVWGLADRYSWLQNLSPRSDGLPKRPLPYDAELHAKPFRSAIAQALASAPTHYRGTARA